MDSACCNRFQMLSILVCLILIILVAGSNGRGVDDRTLRFESFAFKTRSSSSKSRQQQQRRPDAGINSHASSEDWNYVTVRSKAHMFYWLYYTTNSAGYQDRPLILWLQGGPGGSGTGFGNFHELGPLDVNLQPRNTTWLQTASLLFIDNPVGTGYSYVDDASAFTTDVAQISADLLTCMESFMKTHSEFEGIPFYIFSESYGGKMTAAFSAVLKDAINSGKISMNFKGFAMGDSWISPTDSTSSWGPYLYGTSIVSNAGLKKLNKGSEKILQLVKQGQYEEATDAWSDLENLVAEVGADVNFYNIMQFGNSGLRSRTSVKSQSSIEQLYEHHVKVMADDPLSNLMNGPIRQKLKIIPNNVVWGGQSANVFQAMNVDFMKNVTATVNSLINEGSLKVVVYSGQLDLICDVLGTEAWFSQLDIASRFESAERTAHPCAAKEVCYFSKQYRNVEFYWILEAGHMVPVDNGPGALAMVNQIISGR